LAGHSEMNASIWDAEVTHVLRCTLFAQHLGMDTARLDDRAALRLFQDIARRNRVKMERRESDWQGSAFALSPETYARKSGVTADLT
jgi:cardiolipin synthase